MFSSELQIVIIVIIDVCLIVCAATCGYSYIYIPHELWLTLLPINCTVMYTCSLSVQLGTYAWHPFPRTERIFSLLERGSLWGDGGKFKVCDLCSYSHHVHLSPGLHCWRVWLCGAQRDANSILVCAYLSVHFHWKERAQMICSWFKKLYRYL